MGQAPRRADRERPVSLGPRLARAAAPARIKDVREKEREVGNKRRCREGGEVKETEGGGEGGAKTSHRVNELALNVLCVTTSTRDKTVTLL